MNNPDAHGTETQPTAKRSKLWQRTAMVSSDLSSSNSVSDSLQLGAQLVEAYTVGEDHQLDQLLVPFDCRASLAHAEHLFRIGVLTQEERQLLETGLDELMRLYHAGQFRVAREQEDCHTAIEQFLTERYGEVGKKIHTARSRNDQSLVMLRLFMKESLQLVIQRTAQLEQVFRARATACQQIPMPGYTHMQRAMPTTVGVWLGAYADAFADQQPLLSAQLTLLDQNPLGSAAGFGISTLPMRREISTQALALGRTQENPMYCAFSRGFFEASVLQALSMLHLICSRFAVDMMMFTQQECGFFRLPDQFVTGSSIMPQKKNYDLFEIMRANGRVMLAHAQTAAQICAGLGSGYHRDLQNTKPCIVRGIQLCTQTLELLLATVPHIQVLEPALRAAMSDELFATDRVYALVNQGMPFRDAYLQIKDELAAKSSARTDS
jgi:argininosuccinate lyase